MKPGEREAAQEETDRAEMAGEEARMGPEAARVEELRARITMLERALLNGDGSPPPLAQPGEPTCDVAFAMEGGPVARCRRRRHHHDKHYFIVPGTAPDPDAAALEEARRAGYESGRAAMKELVIVNVEDAVLRWDERHRRTAVGAVHRSPEAVAIENVLADILRMK